MRAIMPSSSRPLAPVLLTLFPTLIIHAINPDCGARPATQCSRVRHQPKGLCRYPLIHFTPRALIRAR